MVLLTIGGEVLIDPVRVERE